MSIGPAQGFAAAAGSPADEATRHNPHRTNRFSSGARVPNDDPNRDTVPKAESHDPQRAPSTPLEPEDEVEVQWDTQLKNELIFKYIDGTGKVVLQVPSSEALSVKRGIQKEFDRRAGDAAAKIRRL